MKIENHPDSRRCGDFRQLHYSLLPGLLLCVVPIPAHAAPPVITLQPVSQPVLEGATAFFTVGISNAGGAVSYQWRLDNGSYLTDLGDRGNVFGSRTSALTISNAAAANEGAYSVMVSNADGSVMSSNAFLALVPWRPVIAQQPSNQTALPGGPATFHVSAVGTHPFSYRWRRNGSPLTDGASYSGSTTSALTVKSATPDILGTFSVAVSNALGVAISSGAGLDTVAVTPQGVTLETIASFTGSGTAGKYPYGRLAIAGDNNLYGTTLQGGGNFDSGTVFRVATNGTLTTLVSLDSHSFAPYPGLTWSTNGNLYGVTARGGTSSSGGVFRVTTNGMLTLMASLNTLNGGTPMGELLQASDGNFYGTASSGGGDGEGTVYKLTPTGVLTPLRSFNVKQGLHPFGALVEGTDGSLYGTTQSSYEGFGSIFKLEPWGGLTTLAFFLGTNGWNVTAGLARDDDGTLYGAAYSGGASNDGTLFKLTSDGALVTLHEFSGAADGSNPYGALSIGGDGNLYGTTENGGTYGMGTVFRLDRDGTLTTLAQFDGYQGANPESPPVTGPGGDLYGTTQKGGANGFGAVYRLSPGGPLQITKQPSNALVYLGGAATFSVATFGAQPVSYQWLRNGTNLSDSGTLSGATTRTLSVTNVAVDDVGVYSVIVSNALGAVTAGPAFLQILVSLPSITAQPMTQTGSIGSTVVFSVEALGDEPLAYRWMKNGTNLVDDGRVTGSTARRLMLRDVTAADSGAYSVVVSDDLYWAASEDAQLVVPVDYTPEVFVTFPGDTNLGGIPDGLTRGRDGLLYGTTSSGGDSGNGIIFKLTTDGALTVLSQFDQPGDSLPLGELIQSTDGNFYGCTYIGGPGYSGTIFRMTPSGERTNLYSFMGSDGRSATTLAEGADGNFYGATIYGGVAYSGTVFKMTRGGVLTSLHQFTGGADGNYPRSGLVLSSDGNFYGTTSQGTTNFSGTVYRITPSGTFSTLHTFIRNKDGGNPSGALLEAADGNLYGTVTSGSGSGSGAVFRLAHDGTLTTLHEFNEDEGAIPRAALIQGFDGSLYGTTSQAGLGGYGSVFRLTTNGVFTTLMWFDYVNGAQPASPLVQMPDGTIYGTTQYGGAGDSGTVFRLVPPIVPAPPRIVVQPSNQVVYSGSTVTFAGLALGTAPLAYQWQANGTNLVDSPHVSGSATRTLILSNVTTADSCSFSFMVTNAYGSTLSTAATLTVLVSAPTITVSPTNQTALPGSTVSFDVDAVGSLPMSFEWQFNGVPIADDAHTFGSNSRILILDSIYSGSAGTYSVVVTNGSGAASAEATLTVVPVTAPGLTLRTSGPLSGATLGAKPNSLVVGPDGRLYGTTQNGGSGQAGTVFAVAPDGTLSELHPFAATNDGAHPYAGLVTGQDGNLYGTTTEGGAHGLGTVYQITTNGALSVVYHFQGVVYGGVPYGPLWAGSNGLWFGTASSFGAGGDGVVFQLATNGAYSVLHAFLGGDGAFPIGGLIQAADEDLYGTTSGGGSDDLGAVFRIGTNGILTTLYSFAGASDGLSPVAGLVQGVDGQLYGTASGGGDFGAGTVFKISTNGAFTTLHSFTGGDDGGSPQGALARGLDGTLYGTATFGGAYNDGVIYAISPAGGFTRLAWFDGLNGANPESTLVQARDGSWYGTTLNGGKNGDGVVFQLTFTEPAPPVLRSLIWTNSQWQLSWGAVPGQSYQAQWSADLRSGLWTSLGGSTIATKSVMTATDTAPSGVQRFYRVMQVPPP